MYEKTVYRRSDLNGINCNNNPVNNVDPTGQIVQVLVIPAISVGVIGGIVYAANPSFRKSVNEAVVVGGKTIASAVMWPQKKFNEVMKEGLLKATLATAGALLANKEDHHKAKPGEVEKAKQLDRKSKNRIAPKNAPNDNTVNEPKDFKDPINPKNDTYVKPWRKAVNKLGELWDHCRNK